jgi:hypothetical protein
VDKLIPGVGRAGLIVSADELVLENMAPVAVLPEMETRYGVAVETEMELGTRKVTRRTLPKIVVTAVAVV